MGSYELVVILQPKLKKEEKEKVLADVKKWVKDGKGKVGKEKEWGVKEFTYPINKQKEGLYYLFEVEGGESVNKALQENAQLENKILRYLLIRK